MSAPAAAAPIITLTTDFGLRDGYVAAVKGVLLARCPQARLVDVSHEIAPGDVRGAAFVLAQAAAYFPPGTVHFAVVDPGVGSARRALACAIGGQHFVAPDNGILAWVAAGRGLRAFELERRELWLAEPSAVFHGRDVFAPVAAFLAQGGDLEAVGRELDPAMLVGLETPQPRRVAGALAGEVIHVDRFGNLVTNLRVEGVVGAAEIAGRSIPLRRTYSDARTGELIALRGSSGLLEIARSGGSAAEALGAAAGHVVSFRAARPESEA